MDISLSLQETLRYEVLQNIELEKIEKLIHDRSALVEEMNRVLERVSESRNDYLSTSSRRLMAELMADEIIGFGPLRPLLEDDTVSDILVNCPGDIFVERFGKL